MILKAMLQSKWFWVFLILAGLITTGYIYYSKYQNEKIDSERWKNNYKTLIDSVKYTKDKLNRTETAIKRLSFTVNELKDSVYQKNLYIEKIKQELELSDVQLERLRSVIYMQLFSQNTGTSKITDTVYIDKPGKFKTLNVNDSNLMFEAWWKEIDSVNYSYKYQEEILYWIDLRRKMYNEKGNKRFFLWRWIWPKWQPKGKIKSTNENSEIRAVEINVKQ